MRSGVAGRGSEGRTGARDVTWSMGAEIEKKQKSLRSSVRVETAPCDACFGAHAAPMGRSMHFDSMGYPKSLIARSAACRL